MVFKNKDHTVKQLLDQLDELDQKVQQMSYNLGDTIGSQIKSKRRHKQAIKLSFVRPLTEKKKNQTQSDFEFIDKL